MVWSVVDTHVQHHVCRRLSPSYRMNQMSVMVVDDEPSVRAVMAVALRRAGHTVYEAATGSEALACLSRHGHQIALLVTDVMMPDMNGRQLAAEAERHWPHLQVLYVSGYIDEGLLKGFQLNTVALLSKPFQINHFTAKVEELLGNSEKTF
jgi:CheY-like chemotaxis protein